jgi:hypothetical protein
MRLAVRPLEEVAHVKFIVGQAERPVTTRKVEFALCNPIRAINPMYNRESAPINAVISHLSWTQTIVGCYSRSI